jgi:hypothetical protein
MKAKMLKISLLLPDLFHVRGAWVAIAAPAALPRCGFSELRYRHHQAIFQMS